MGRKEEQTGKVIPGQERGFLEKFKSALKLIPGMPREFWDMFKSVLKAQKGMRAELQTSLLR